MPGMAANGATHPRNTSLTVGTYAPLVVLYPNTCSLRNLCGVLTSCFLFVTMTIESDHYGQQALVLQRMREHERTYPPDYLYTPVVERPEPLEPLEPLEPCVSVGRIIGGTLAASIMLSFLYMFAMEVCKPVEHKITSVEPAHMFKNYRKGK